MKTLLAALVVTLSTLALAGQPPATTAAPDMSATEAGPSMGATTIGTGTSNASPEMKSTKSYNAQGTVKTVSADSLVLARPHRKDSSLEIRPDTIVMLDDKKVDASALPEGSQVRARFQREGQKLIAVEIDATSPKIK
jgi:hypothetical protein